MNSSKTKLWEPTKLDFRAARLDPRQMALSFDDSEKAEKPKSEPQIEGEKAA